MLKVEREHNSFKVEIMAQAEKAKSQAPEIRYFKYEKGALHYSLKDRDSSNTADKKRLRTSSIHSKLSLQHIGISH